MHFFGVKRLGQSKQTREYGRRSAIYAWYLVKYERTRFSVPENYLKLELQKHHDLISTRAETGPIYSK